jgi:hypothetical protein
MYRMTYREEYCTLDHVLDSTYLYVVFFTNINCSFNFHIIVHLLRLLLTAVSSCSLVLCYTNLLQQKPMETEEELQSAYAQTTGKREANREQKFKQILILS